MVYNLLIISILGGAVAACNGSIISVLCKALAGLVISKIILFC